MDDVSMHNLIEAYRRQVWLSALETMTQHIEKKLEKRRIELLRRRRAFDAAEWQSFLLSLSKSDRRFVEKFLPEIGERLMRIITKQQEDVLILENSPCQPKRLEGPNGAGQRVGGELEEAKAQAVDGGTR